MGDPDITLVRLSGSSWGPGVTCRRWELWRLCGFHSTLRFGCLCCPKRRTPRSAPANPSKPWAKLTGAAMLWAACPFTSPEPALEAKSRANPA